jgi:uncharacterized protein
MSKALADRVDVKLLALQGVRAGQEYPLAGLPRLRESLLSPAGLAVAQFVFQQVEGMPAVQATVEATVQLRCQRCLQPFGCPLESRARLVFVTSDAEAGRVPEGWEAITVDPHRVELAELVEDELLLSLPIVPLHAAAARCQPAAELVTAAEMPEPEPAIATQRPFAALKDLLKH